MRTFEGGAVRDTDEGKLDFEGALSPLVLTRFAEYMAARREQPDGKFRSDDNWQLGIPIDVYMKSMFRHFMSVWASHRNGGASEEELCAVLFNAMGMLHEIIKSKQHG